MRIPFGIHFQLAVQCRTHTPTVGNWCILICFAYVGRRFGPFRSCVIAAELEGRSTAVQGLLGWKAEARHVVLPQ
jgi:hypothetical protein